MKKKMIVPVFITVVMLLFLLGYLAICFFVPDFPIIFKIIAGCAIVFFMGVSVYNLVERIKEIRSGEEDDLSNY